MAYKRINVMDIYEIIRRWHAGQAISEISRALCYDRKTVRKYIKKAKGLGLSTNIPLPEKEKCLKMFETIECKKEYSKPSMNKLLPYKQELIQLINKETDPLKPKTAFEVISEKYRLNVSYTTFKRFFKIHDLGKHKTTITCRIETPPGQILQIDYAKVGTLHDPSSGKNRNVYAFIATLAYSRHKYVEFTFKQDKKSFIYSHIHAFEFFGCVPRIISIDNLKNGILKADLYDPKLNPSYQEMAEHYNCFIDPCRVRKPKDKAKVERDVQTVREQFRKLKALNPDLTIILANKKILTWLTDDYGKRNHGTTRRKPYELFEEKEKQAMIALPSQPFEYAEWKRAKVHPDCYIQYQKKFYSVPYKYVGKTVWIKAAEKIISIYYNHKLIKQHVISDQIRHTDMKDFPENHRAVLDQGYHKRLLIKAKEVGFYFHKLIESLFKSHAFLNLRRAQSLFRLLDEHSFKEVDRVAKEILYDNIPATSQNFKKLLNNQQADRPPLIGKKTQEYIRQADYFVHYKERGRNDE